MSKRTIKCWYCGEQEKNYAEMYPHCRECSMLLDRKRYNFLRRISRIFREKIIYKKDENFIEFIRNSRVI